MSGRNVLFFSEFCFFSKDAVALVTKKNVSASFLMVCVDSYRTMLPAFVRSVPTIFTHDRRVLEGELALQFVEAMSEVRDDSADAGGNTPVEHCPQGSSWSEGFSFLEPSEHPTGMSAFSGLTEDSRIQCVPDDAGDPSAPSSASASGSRLKSSSPLAAYMSVRDSDTESLRKNQLGSS